MSLLEPPGLRTIGSCRRRLERRRAAAGTLKQPSNKKKLYKIRHQYDKWTPDEKMKRKSQQNYCVHAA